MSEIEEIIERIEALTVEPGDWNPEESWTWYLEITLSDVQALAAFAREQIAVLTEALDAWEQAEARVERLKDALRDIAEASRDDGLAAMCNWMRGRAGVALREEAPNE